MNSTVRLSNLLPMMRQRVDVKADEFQNSLGPVAEVVGSQFQVRVVRRSVSSSAAVVGLYHVATLINAI